MTGPNASDAAKKLARDEAIDLGEVKGTGKGGNIGVGDVRKAIDAKKAEATGDVDTAATSADGQVSAESNDDQNEAAETIGDEGAAVGAGEPTGDAGDAAEYARQREAELADAGVNKPLTDPVAVDDAPKGKTATVAKTNDDGAWWCPFCDHSQTEIILECVNCGAQKESIDSDKVKRGDV